MKDNFDIGSWKSKMLRENKEDVNEFTSTSKLDSNPDYKFLMNQLESYIKDEDTLRQVKKIASAIGELGLDVGYGEAIGDEEMKNTLKVAENK